MPARAFNISAEFGGPPGLTTLSNGVANQTVLQQQQANNTSIIDVPAGTVLTQFGGTVTLKTPGELLIVMIIDGTPVWSGEFITKDMDTWVIIYPIPTTWTPKQIYLDFAYNNNSANANPGAGVEYQITFPAA